MATKTIGLAAAVIAAANREKPADQVLRDRLKSEGHLTRFESREVSAIVFAYYRWRGWLDETTPVAEQIALARELNRRFSRDPGSFPPEELLARAAPAWTLGALEVTPGWAAALQAEPRLWLRARPGTGPALARHLGDCRAFGDGPLADSLDYMGREDLFRTSEFHAGEFEVQDLASQAVSWVCAPKPGETWWDACAGEGGKTLHLSDLMENKGLIWATDRAAWRLEKLRRRAGRAKVFNYRVAAWDGGDKLPTATRFDGVLVDGPCTGTGTWQRNPHARWTTTPGDVAELASAQAALLTRASGAVKPGGRLIYSVCTLTRAETSAVAAAFDQAAPGFKRLPCPNPLAPAAPAGTELFLRPEDYRANGMFVAVWQRE